MVAISAVGYIYLPSYLDGCRLAYRTRHYDSTQDPTVFADRYIYQANLITYTITLITIATTATNMHFMLVLTLNRSLIATVLAALFLPPVVE
jgi:hypothetical protein